MWRGTLAFRVLQRIGIGTAERERMYKGVHGFHEALEKAGIATDWIWNIADQQDGKGRAARSRRFDDLVKTL